MKRAGKFTTLVGLPVRFLVSGRDVMKSFLKSIIFASILFAFSACGPLTPMPSVTPTGIPTATRNPVMTATPSTATQTPQPTLPNRLWEQLPPSQPVDKYELAAWDESLSKDLDEIRFAAGAEDYHYHQLTNVYRAAFQSEAWLHAQTENEKSDVMCNTVFDAPGSQIFPVLRPGQDVFSFYVENLLNENNFPVERLSEPFEDAFGLPGCLNALLVTGAGNIFFEPAFVHNLFGGGQDAYVFAVGTVHGNNRFAIYAAHSVDGVIYVEKVQDWAEYTMTSQSMTIRLVGVGDVNANGYNELVVDVDYGASGYPGYSAEWLYWYEWQPGNASFVGSEAIDVFSHGWNIGPSYGEWSMASTNIPGTISVTAREFLSTNLKQCDVSAFGGVLIYERKYQLTKDKLVLKSGELLFPNNSTAACELSWAYETLTQPEGWKNDRAIKIVSSALENWPDEMNSAWNGAAAKNYFRLMLGVWRDFRGEKELATTVLEPLISSDTQNPRFISQLAKVYLDTRKESGVIAACSKMNSLQRELLDGKYSDAAARLMGFQNPKWWTVVDDFCDESVVVAAAAPGSFAEYGEISDVDKLREWLAYEQRSEVYIKKLNVGSREIWLASFLVRNFPKYDIDIYQLWAFLKTDDGLSATPLNKMRLDSTQDDVSNLYNENSISASMFEPEPGAAIALVQFDNCVNFLKPSSAGVLDILGTECGNELFFSPHNNQVNVLINEYYYPREWKLVTYYWNPASLAFDKVENQNYDFLAAQHEAERLIYKEKDYIGAVVYINKFLLEAPSEQVFSPLCYENIARDYDNIQTDPTVALCDLPPEWHRPYLRYLLGLAYEMAGQPDMAKLAFYALWNEYPTNLFGIAASKRLTLIEP
jgi:hypothetical protein